MSVYGKKNPPEAGTEAQTSSVLLKLEHFQKLILGQPHGIAAHKREISPKSGEAAEMENNISWLLHTRAFFLGYAPWAACLYCSGMIGS